MEKHSAIYIEAPQWPVYFTENVFAGNVGVFGGAISINTPTFKNSTDFRLRRLQKIATAAGLGTVKSLDFADTTGMEVWNDVENQPVVVIYNNRFENNQAYLSGNAIYARYTR